MTVITPSLVLADVSRHLRSVAPREWERFVEVMTAYADEVTVAVTTAQQNDILNHQGRAQAFRHLAKTFRECHVTPTPKPPSA